jgi:hypothetical protein
MSDHICRDKCLILSVTLLFRQLSEGTLEGNHLVDGSRVTLLPRAETGLLVRKKERKKERKNERKEIGPGNKKPILPVLFVRNKTFSLSPFSLKYKRGVRARRAARVAWCPCINLFFS